MLLAIYGTGGSGRELYEMIKRHGDLDSKWSEIIFIDDTKEGFYRGLRIIKFETFCKEFKSNCEVVIAVGEPASRQVLCDKVKQNGYELATILSPTAIVNTDANIQSGVVVRDNCIISSSSYIGENTWINSNSIVGHDVVIGKNCQISSFVMIAGKTHIGDNVYIGGSASIRERLEVGEFAVISMGAVVLKNVGASKIVMGNPGREIAENNDRKVFK